jgi:hypothetical protein
MNDDDDDDNYEYIAQTNSKHNKLEHITPVIYNIKSENHDN